MYKKSVAFFALMATMACNPAESPDATPAQPDSEVAETGYLYLTHVIPFTADNVAELASSPDGQAALSLLATDGWTWTERGFETTKKVSPAELSINGDIGLEFEVYMNGKATPVGADGSLIVDGDINTDDIMVMAYADDGAEAMVMNSENVQLNIIEMDGIKSIEIVSYVAEHNHDGHDDHDTGSQANMAPPPSSYLPCRDYNGRWGNCSSSASGYQRYLNFIGSDCYYAIAWWGICFMDFTSWDYCNGSRNCSWMVGHSSSHHCH